MLFDRAYIFHTAPNLQINYIFALENTASVLSMLLKHKERITLFDPQLNLPVL